MMPAPAESSSRPSAWSLAGAFAIVYLAWGTTYLAIQAGVRTLPPGLFGGVRVALAGLLLLGFLALRGRSLRLPPGELPWAALVGVLMFVGGNGLLTAAEKTVPSGAAAVLVTTTPLWLALLGMLWPRGDRLTGLGWAGLLLGMAGVLVLLEPSLKRPHSLLEDAGPLMVLGSAFCWSVGSLVLRHRRSRGDHLTTAGYHMLLGGGAMTVLGLLMGEAAALRPESFTLAAVSSFFYLLVVGSLIAFLAYTWLLRHVSATLVGTHAYVNPLVALLVGAALAEEQITRPIIGGMVIILAGVALVRAGCRKPAAVVEITPAEERVLPAPIPRPALCEASEADRR